MTHVLLCFCILLPVVAFAQPAPVESWAHQFGGYDDDEANAVRPTNDGGYIAAGTSSSFEADEGLDMYVVKTDAVGTLRWQQHYGGNEDEEAFAILEVTNGFLIAGRTNSFGHGESDVYVVRIDTTGDTLWTRAWGGMGLDGATAMLRARDGNYVVAGYTESIGAGERDMYLIKFGLAGNLIWQHAYGGYVWDIAWSVDECHDGGFALAGYTTSMTYGWNDFYLVRTDSAGNFLWHRHYGGGGWDEAYGVKETSDFGYVMIGATDSWGHGGLDFCVVRVDTIGDTLWTGAYGGTSNERAYAMHLMPDKGIVLAGYTYSFWPEEQAYLMKIDSTGDPVWSRAYGYQLNQMARALAHTSGNSFILAGYTDQLSYLSRDFYFLKLGPDPYIGADEPPVPLPFGYSLSAYPNPFNPQTTITFAMPASGSVYINVYDITGRVVARLTDGFYPVGVHALRFDGSALAAGMYIVKLSAGSYAQAQTVSLVK